MWLQYGYGYGTQTFWADKIWWDPWIVAGDIMLFCICLNIEQTHVQHKCVQNSWWNHEFDTKISSVHVWCFSFQKLQNVTFHVYFIVYHFYLNTFNDDVQSCTNHKICIYLTYLLIWKKCGLSPNLSTGLFRCMLKIEPMEAMECIFDVMRWINYVFK